MDGVTLLDARTTRAHFALARSLEDAPTPGHAAAILRNQIAEIKHTLSHRAARLNPSSLSEQIILLLHCIHASPYPPRPSTLQFALVPALHLVATGRASSWEQAVGYAALRYLLPRPDTTKEGLPSARASTSASIISEAGHDSDQSAALLLINTVRQHLSNASVPSTSSYGAQRSSGADAMARAATAKLALEALIEGVPGGPETVPAVFDPVLALTRHPVADVRRHAFGALLALASHDERVLVDATSSALALMQGNQELSTAHDRINSEARSPQGRGKQSERASPSSERDPGVIRAVVRVLSHALQRGIVPPAEVVTTLLRVLEDLRKKGSDHVKSNGYIYHGVNSPWLQCAVLDALRDCLVLSKPAMGLPASDPASTDAPGTLDKAMLYEIQEALLGTYALAAHLTDAAYAVCLSAARVLGQLPILEPHDFGNPDGSDPWEPIRTHVRAQLGAKNSNKRVLAVRLLDALGPSRWTGVSAPDATASVKQGENLGHEQRSGPASQSKNDGWLNENDMGRLMSFLADKDDTLRRATIRMLHRVDPSIPSMHIEQLLDAVRDAHASHLDASIIRRQQEELALRALEGAWVRASCVLEGRRADSARTEAMAKEYVEALKRTLNALDPGREDGSQPVREAVVERVLDIRGGTHSFRAQITQAFLRAASPATLSAQRTEEVRSRTSTEILLAAVICCEFGDAPMSQLEHQGSDAPSTFVQEQHESLAALLLRPDQSATLQEALLIALVRVASRCPSATWLTSTSIAASIEKLGERSGPLVALRCRQYLRLVSDAEALRMIAEAASGSTLLDTLQAIEAFFAGKLQPRRDFPFPRSRSTSTSSGASTSSPGSRARSPPSASISFGLGSKMSASRSRPLRYAAYDAPTPSSGRGRESSSSRNEPRRNGQTDAEIRSKRRRDKAVEEAMSASVARLALMGTEEPDDHGDPHYADLRESQLPAGATAAAAAEQSSASDLELARPDLILFDADTELHSSSQPKGDSDDTLPETTSSRDQHASTSNSASSSTAAEAFEKICENVRQLGPTSTRRGWSGTQSIQLVQRLHAEFGNAMSEVHSSADGMVFQIEDSGGMNRDALMAVRLQPVPDCSTQWILCGGGDAARKLLASARAALEDQEEA